MIDVNVVIDILTSNGLLRSVKPMGDWYQCYCPFHNGGNEQKPSFGISLHEQVKNGVLYKSGFGHCFACGYSKPLNQMLSDIFSSNGIKKSA